MVPFQEILYPACFAGARGAAQNGQRVPATLLTESRVTRQGCQERNTQRPRWTDTPELTKVLARAIEEVKIKRELEKDLKKLQSYNCSLSTSKPALPTGAACTEDTRLSKQRQGGKEHSRNRTNCKLHKFI